jgi:hypothetical protein
LKFITKEAIDSLNDDYYKNRYGYLKEVIGHIKIMDNVHATLELGPYKTPLVEGGDVIDIRDAYLDDYPIKIGKFYKHDCSLIPYPLKDKQYDLVIACQVLEHLGKNQKEVFKELSRISKKAIITLPYKWNRPCDPHHMIDEKIIDNWANSFKPVFEKIFENRILRIYDFDNEVTSLKYIKKVQECADFQVSNELNLEKKRSNEFEKCLNQKESELNQVLNELEVGMKRIKELEEDLSQIESELHQVLRQLDLEKKKVSQLEKDLNHKN